MRHLAAYLLLVVGGNTTPTADDVTAVLEKAGVDVESERLTQLITELEGKDVAELIALGRDKLHQGGVAAAAAAPAAAGGAPAGKYITVPTNNLRISDLSLYHPVSNHVFFL